MENLVLYRKYHLIAPATLTLSKSPRFLELASLAVFLRGKTTVFPTPFDEADIFFF